MAMATKTKADTKALARALEKALPPVVGEVNIGPTPLEELGQAVLALVSRYNTRIATQEPTGTERRRAQVTRLAAKGYSQRQIAEELGLSRSTVRDYL